MPNASLLASHTCTGEFCINKKRPPVKDDLSLYNGFSWLIKQVADAKLHLPA